MMKGQVEDQNLRIDAMSFTFLKEGIGQIDEKVKKGGKTEKISQGRIIKIYHDRNLHPEYHHLASRGLPSDDKR